MLETVQATADIDLVGDPFDLAQQVARDPNLWKRIGYDKARLAGDASGLGSLVLRRQSYGENKGRCAVVAEGNLASLLYGKVGKSLTLPLGDSAAALDALVAEAVKALPNVAPRMLASWKVSRVDASVTWAIQPQDAVPAFEGFRSAVFGLQGLKGRAEASQPGPRSLMLRRTKEDLVRIYCKSSESLANGSPLPAAYSDPSRSILIRLESQIVARTARKIYGDTLDTLASGGTAVAARTLRDWLDMLGGTHLAAGNQEVFMRLVLGGIPPEAAFGLVGPAVALRTGGIDALVSHGVARRTAYRWQARIREAVPDEAWSEVLGIPLDLEDAVFADTHCERLL